MAGRRRRPDTTWMLSQRTKSLSAELDRIDSLLCVVGSDASDVATLKDDLAAAVGRALAISADVDGHMLRHAEYNARKNFQGSRAQLHRLRKRAGAVVPPLAKTLAELIEQAGATATDLAATKAVLKHEPGYHQTADQVLNGGGPTSLLAVLAVLAMWLRRRD